jgi:hypothetical protein
MPSLSDAFLTLAEIGVGLAGFAGIALALTRRDAPLTPGQAIFVRELILNSLAVIFLALLPVSLGLLELQGQTVWRTLSGLHFAIIVLVAWPSLFIQVRRVELTERDPIIRIAILPIQMATAAVQFLNLTGVFFAPSGGVYFLGICAPLAVGAVHFARLLFARLL